MVFNQRYNGLGKDWKKIERARRKEMIETLPNESYANAVVRHLGDFAGNGDGDITDSVIQAFRTYTGYREKEKIEIFGKDLVSKIEKIKDKILLLP